MFSESYRYVPWVGGDLWIYDVKYLVFVAITVLKMVNL